MFSCPEFRTLHKNNFKGKFKLLSASKVCQLASKTAPFTFTLVRYTKPFLSADFYHYPGATKFDGNFPCSLEQRPGSCKSLSISAFFGVETSTPWTITSKRYLRDIALVSICVRRSLPFGITQGASEARSIKEANGLA